MDFSKMTKEDIRKEAESKLAAKKQRIAKKNKEYLKGKTCTKEYDSIIDSLTDKELEDLISIVQFPYNMDFYKDGIVPNPEVILLHEEDSRTELIEYLELMKGGK